MADPRMRQLKIKTGVVKRLAKEKLMYEKEVVAQEKKIETMKASGADEYDIRKQNEVLEESRCVIPDVGRKLVTAREDLQQFLDNDTADLKETPEYKTAVEVLAI